VRARENPFRTQRLEGLAFRLGDQRADLLLERFRRMGNRAAIVGPHGSGKTTLARELGDRLAAGGRRVHRRFLNAESPRSARLGWVGRARAMTGEDVLILDGAGHLPRALWWRLRRASRRAGGVLVTAHQAGMLPTLIETRSDAALLTELCRELVGAQADPLVPLLETLWQRHRGNLREVFLALYDLRARDDPRLAPAAAAGAPAQNRMRTPARGPW
jgi:hypothetical protein